MTAITIRDGKIVLRDGKVGTEQACCCGEVECSGISGGLGWYTDSEKQDFINFLATAGYSNPTFTPAQPFNDPVSLPYSSPCDQVYYEVNYECCGVTGLGNPCDPSFFITNILTVVPGNKSPPCNPGLVENFLWACCEEEPPP